MKARIIPQYPETAVLLYIDDEKSGLIGAAMEKLGVRVIIPEKALYGQKVGFLTEQQGFVFDKNAPDPCEGDELMIFSGITSKRLDVLLSALRRAGIVVRFKAVVTEYNRTMYLPQLMECMYSEEKELGK